MRLLILRIGCWAAMTGAAAAQSSTSDSSSVTQLPVGQVYKDFQFPLYQDGQLKFTLAATEAKGITINRAETTDVKINLYDSGKLTTTITSPKADIYVADRKMRTNNTVRIVRADMDATAQICDFDLLTKQYLLRTNVKVILKNFDAGVGLSGKPAPAPGGASPAHPLSDAPSLSTPSIVPSAPSTKTDSILESPGSFSSTNAAPTPQ
jgi:hypothetical protein